MRIALFATCLADGLFPTVGRATVHLLERLGHEVLMPDQQVCCGQMHINSGYPREAARVLANQVRAFEGADLVVSPSGSCTASLKHQGESVLRSAGSFALLPDLKDLQSRTFELSEFIVDILGTADVGAYYPHPVTYHPTCHSLRLLKVGDRPTRLLRNVEGLDLLELPEAETCCGFGGTFALKNNEVSGAMLDDKVRNIVESGARAVVMSDASCLMHIGGGIRRRRIGVAAVHLAEVLAGTRDAPWEDAR